MSIGRLLLVWLALALVVFGQSAVPRINPQNAFALVESLTSPEMQGRRSGTPGGERAAEFIASKFAQYGVAPAGDNGTYLQHYTFPMVDYTGPCAMAVLRGGETTEFSYGRDFQLETVSGGGQVEAEVVFVGYGLSDPEFDEYASVDARGKVVLALEGVPLSAGRRLARKAGQPQAKEEQAVRHGARALLLIPNPAKGKSLTAMRIWGVQKEEWQPNLIVARVEPYVAALLLERTGKRLDVLKKQVDSQLRPQSFVIPGEKVSVRAGVTLDPDRKTANVIAVLPGSDVALKNEFIILGGHYDMGGIDPTGEVYSGAEDDASGTALVLELARVLAPLRSQLKRSVVFAAWAAEEQGYSGSEYYAAHPPFDLAKTVANFWLDNAGVGDGGFYVFGATVYPELYDYVSARLNPATLAHAQPGYYLDYSFMHRGVPFFFTHTTGSQPFNHTPWDRPYMVSEQALESIGQYVLEATIALANAPAGIIREGNGSEFVVRSTPVFDLHPFPLSQLPTAGKTRFAQQMQRHGPAVFFGQVDDSRSDLLDQLASAKRFRDDSGKDVPLISNSNFPRSYSSDSLSALVLTADAAALLRHPDRKEILRTLGLRALTLRGREGKLPTEFLAPDGTLSATARGLLSGFPLLLEALDSAAIKVLAGEESLLVVTDAANVGTGRFNAAEQQSMAASGALLALQFPCSTTSVNVNTTESITRQLSVLKQIAGADHLMLNPELSSTPYATTLLSIVQALQAQGWANADIRNALGENLQRAWQESFTLPNE